MKDPCDMKYLSTFYTSETSSDVADTALYSSHLHKK